MKSKPFLIDLDELERDLDEHFPNGPHTSHVRFPYNQLAEQAFNSRERFSRENLSKRTPNYVPDNTDWEMQQLIGSINTKHYAAFRQFGNWYFSLKTYYDRYEVHMNNRFAFCISDKVHVCEQIINAIRGIADGINNLSTGERVACVLSHKLLPTSTWGKKYSHLLRNSLKIPRELDSATLEVLWETLVPRLTTSWSYDFLDMVRSFCLPEYCEQANGALHRTLSILNVARGNLFLEHLKKREKQELGIVDIYYGEKAYALSKYVKGGIVYDCTEGELCTDPSTVSAVKAINELASSIA